MPDDDVPDDDVADDDVPDDDVPDDDGSRAFGVPGEVWRVEDRAGVLVCEIVVDEMEDFFLRGELRPGPAWADIAGLLDARERLGGPDGERVRDEINERFTLRYPSGRPVDVFTLTVSGDRAGFRWAD